MKIKMDDGVAGFFTCARAIKQTSSSSSFVIVVVVCLFLFCFAFLFWGQRVPTVLGIDKVQMGRRVYLSVYFDDNDCDCMFLFILSH